MANEIRLRANNISGTTTDNPLTAGAVTINSPGFVDLPVVNTTNHLILILDPLETAGQAEIVQVTAHSASSSVVTVVRGFETTTPRQHSLGTTWFHGPVASDYGGMLSYTQVIADQVGIVTATDITGLTTTLTYGSNRRIRVTGSCLGQNTGTNQIALTINEGATILTLRQQPISTVNQDYALFAQSVFSPTPGSHTYKLVMQTVAGTTKMSANALYPAFISVEDLGPNLVQSTG